MTRHAPHINCADDSSYADTGSNTVEFKCNACGASATWNGRCDYEAFQTWMAHKDAWFKQNPEFAPASRTLGTIKISKSGKATWVK